MRLKIFETYFFKKLISIGNLSFLLIFFKKSIFILHPTFILQANCITTRTVNQNINMMNCLIKDFSSTGHGGAIYIDSSSLSLIFHDTTFYNCTTSSGNGGAIYFTNGLNIQLFRICAVGCNTNTHYQFAYLQTTSNQVLDLITIYNCSNLIGYETLRFENGKQNISNINVSYNNNYVISGFIYVCSNNIFSNYCTFYNNTVGLYRCIDFHGYSGTISKSNIILNNSPNSNGVIYIDSGNYIFNECIFDQNKNILLYLYTGSTLQLNNCYYLTGASSTFGSITNSLIISNTNYYLYSIYSTYYCSYFYPKFNPTISKTIFPIISFTFFIFIFSK